MRTVADDARWPSVALVAPYFGPLPGHFPLLLRTIARNDAIRWLLVTDQDVPAAPDNVTVVATTFEAFVARVQAHYDFRIGLASPYKICDFRPAFGELFAEELAGHEWWGHCDFDVLFGDVRRCLPARAFAEHDKVLIRGNLAFYRNDPTVNAWYRHVVPGADWRKAFAATVGTHFDEWTGVQRIVDALGVSTWDDAGVVFDVSADRYALRTNQHPDRPVAFTWNDGRLYEHSAAGVREGALLHLQKRRMRPPDADVLAAPCVEVRPDRFVVCGGRPAITAREVSRAAVEFHARRVRRRLRTLRTPTVVLGTDRLPS